MEDAANGIPLEQCRGIEHIDLNDSLFLVQAPIEQVAQAFSQFPQLVLWERDAYEHEIEILGYGLMVFQFRGHPWTLIHQLNFMTYQSPLQIPFKDEDIELLSRSLHTKAICYQISDSSHNIGYHLYDCGESIESYTQKEKTASFNPGSASSKPKISKTLTSSLTTFFESKMSMFPPLVGTSSASELVRELLCG